MSLNRLVCLKTAANCKRCRRQWWANGISSVHGVSFRKNLTTSTHAGGNQAILY